MTKKNKATGDKPEITKVTRNGKTVYLGTTDVAKWIAKTFKISCTMQAVCAVIKDARKPPRKGVTIRSIMQEHYPQFTGK